jgi:ComF family protein
LFLTNVRIEYSKVNKQSRFIFAYAGQYKRNMKTLIYKLKYDGDRRIAYDLGQLLVAAWSELEKRLSWNLDDIVIVPVPLHPRRLRSRGFNQAELLASCLSKATGLYVNTSALQRVKNTKAMYGLPRVERVDNISSAFHVGGHELLGKKIILVDDICTSGMTLSACVDVLKRAGAAEVVALVAARAI